MEPWQKEHIRKNFVELITICSPQLIASFTAANILNFCDTQSLELTTLTPFERTKKLYEILQTRVGAFEVLMKSLQESKQSGAFQILKGHAAIVRNFGCISYDSNHVLGTGNSGTKVFKGAFDGRDVAVKVVNSDVIPTHVALQEVEFLKKLDDHENILRYFFAEAKDNFIYIALELSEISLQDEVRMQLLKLDPVPVLFKCAKGLAHLHAHNIIHRDMKPANVLLNQSGQVKISDFGLSKQIPAGMTSVSVHSGVRGTADWMAPEVLQHLLLENATSGSIRMSTSADVFSLGCIFFFALSKGSHPFGDQFARLANIHNYVPVLKTDNKKIDVSWLHLIKLMISFQPSERPSASEIIHSECFMANINDDVNMSTKSAASKLVSDNERCFSSNQSVRPMPAPRQPTTGPFSNSSESGNVAKESVTRHDLGGNNSGSGKPINNLIHMWQQLELVAPKEHTGQRSAKVKTYPKRTLPSNEELFNQLSPAIKKVLQGCKGDVNSVDENGDNALFLAVCYGATKSELEHFVKLGYDWRQRNHYGDTILHQAARYGNLEALKYFVDLGADIYSMNQYDDIALHMVSWATKNIPEMLKFLLENKLYINAVNKDGNNVLFLSAARGKSKEELQEIVKLGGYWKAKNKRGHSILHLAAEGGNFEALKYFISLGANIHARDNFDETVLHRLSYTKQNFTETLKFLLETKLDINAVNKGGNNLLFLSAIRGRSKEELQEIVKVGGEWKTKNKDGQSMLHLVAHGGNVEALKYFISLGSDVTSKADYNETPIHRLQYAGQNVVECVAVLVKHGADINAKDAGGNTLEMRLQKSGRNEELVSLRSHGYIK